MIGENVKLINLFLILIKLIGSIFYAARKVIDSLLETHAPLKKFNKKELKFLTKPWITQGLENSIKKKKNRIEFLKCKYQNLKEFYHNNYKSYRNL